MIIISAGLRTTPYNIFMFFSRRKVIDTLDETFFRYSIAKNVFSAAHRNLNPVVYLILLIYMYIYTYI